tara:strand:+ start:251 stop:703 length:453 start_codon:yes stop_codon:yes gene_type:complete
MSHIISYGFDDVNHKYHQQQADESGAVKVVRPVIYEDPQGTLTGTGALIVYGSNNGTSIDMKGYRHLTIKVRSSATTGTSPLQNLRMYYSHDGGDFCMGEIVEQNELPGGAGNYQGVIRIKDVGFRYVQLIAIGVVASPTQYWIHYNRYN